VNGGVLQVCTCNVVYVGMMSAAASLGLVLLWDIDAGLTHLDKYLYSKEDYIKVNTLYVVYAHSRSHVDEYHILLVDVDIYLHAGQAGIVLAVSVCLSA